MKALAFATIKKLQHLIHTKQLSAQEAIRFFTQRFAQHDPQIDSALEVFDDASILGQSNGQGPLYGIPGLIKDNIVQQGRKLTCASKILQNFTATYDATAIAHLKAQGACLLGRANMDEFAMGSSTESSAYKKTRNPWDVRRVPGGSSGGSAAAVAAGFVPWALGSDTGGSVRQPAAFCGIVGLKPTYGLVSRYGLVAYGSSLDQIGVFSRTIYDNAVILSAIAGHDERDATSAQQPKKEYARSVEESSKKLDLTIGVVENACNAQGMDPEVQKALQDALDVLQKNGARIKKIALPTLDDSAAVYFIISRAEAASNLARFDGVRYGARDMQAQTLTQMYAQTRSHGFGEEVRDRILVGNYVLSAGHAGEFYQNANRVRALMVQDFMAAFKEVDLLFMPTHPAPAFAFGAYDVNKLQMDLQDYFTCAMNLTGNPALSVPCGMSSGGLPIGFQLVGPHFGEDLLYQVGHVYEQATPWHTYHPKAFVQE